MLVEETRTKVLGKAVLRKEDRRLITGKDTFVAGMKKPGMLHLALVRSPYAHARILSVKTSKAAKHRNVRAVLTWDDVKDFKVYWFTHRELRKAECYPLAAQKVRYVGEPVAAVVAESLEDAKDAAELVEMEFDPLPAVVSVEDGMKEGATLLYDDWGDNISMHSQFQTGDVEKVFAEADHVFEEKLSVHRHSPVPIEPRAYLAEYDRSSDSITLWATTQTPHLLRTIIAESIHHPESKIRVIEPDVGGSFGGKMPLYHEELLVCLIARSLGLPVKFVEDRTENLTTMHQAREQTHYLKVAVSRDGQLLAIKDKVVGNLGVSFPTTGSASLITATRFIPSCYKLKAYQAEIVGVATNKPPYGAYRGYGKDAANFIIERLVNIVAKRLQLDPVALRLRNFIRPDEFPYRNVAGALYDSGDYAACLTKAAHEIGYEDFRREQAQMRKKSRYLGVGFSVVLEPSGSHFPGSMMMGYETATARLLPSGSVAVFTGVTSTGTSHETVFAQIASEVLGVPYQDVSVIEGDTDLTPYGFGNWASRSVVLGANALYLACLKLRKKVIKVASLLFDAPEADLRLEDGYVVSAATGKKLALKEVAAASYYMDPRIPPTIPPGLDETEFFFPSTVGTVADKGGGRNAYAAYGYSVNAAIVEVDIQTGATKTLRYIVCADPGRILNPQVVEGQVVGGVAQGFGGALLEENVYSEDGQPLAANLADYAIPSSVEIPNIEVSHTQTPSPLLPLGAKGVGEGGAEGVAATLGNAVEDALAPFNIDLRELSLKPESVWMKIRQASGQNSAPETT